MVQTERRGIYKGKEYIFTHYNMAVREVYSPDIASSVDGQLGTWVNMDNVKWLDENNHIVKWRLQCTI